VHRWSSVRWFRILVAITLSGDVHHAPVGRVRGERLEPESVVATVAPPARSPTATMNASTALGAGADVHGVNMYTLAVQAGEDTGIGGSAANDLREHRGYGGSGQRLRAHGDDEGPDAAASSVGAVCERRDRLTRKIPRSPRQTPNRSRGFK
jgi:hypothetical protein